MNTPRLRIFAGPNGSGKSTLKSVINDVLLGIYINPDEIEKGIKKDAYLDLSTFKIEARLDEYASVCADFIRQNLLKLKISFTFETVMSSDDKIELLNKAQKSGYRTYLYFIATQDPLINISRVKNRVLNGGHDVPKDKIVSRYYRSLELLSDAVKYSNRAYIFDNSSSGRKWLAQINNGNEVELKTQNIPMWVDNYLLNK